MKKRAFYYIPIYKIKKPHRIVRLLLGAPCMRINQTRKFVNAELALSAG
jgi:hypothetical protein